jgi:NAD(P)-dependent dehydrogenase (short-subunit alcohol dehydrogenase family)
MRLKGKTILITGSYTGIGRAMARACVHEGGRVVLNGLQDSTGIALADELGKKNSIYLTIDITLKNAPQQLVNLAIDTFGGLDAVVNNAALVESADIDSTDLPYLRRMLEVNTIAPFAMIRAALPHLIKTKGCVLNIGSVNSWSGEPKLLPYSISKGALMTMSRNLGDTLFRDKGVRVNQINPGWVLTEHELVNQREQGRKDDWHKNVHPLFAPAGRIFKPEEIAAAAVFFLSDECGPVSGQVIELEQFPMIGRNLAKPQ